MNRVRVEMPRSLALFALAAIAEIGGTWLIWQGVREGVEPSRSSSAAPHSSSTVSWPPSSPMAHFGRVLAAYGGIFVAGSLLWGMAADGYRPDAYDLAGAGICLLGVAVIMYAPH